MLQTPTMEGLHGLTNIYEALCYNSWIEDYEGLYGIKT